ncbi:hypothetical protein [Leuconostoc pseudomesenteroides]|uniref:hypothetical protein n=1 Tax=Leuconostoc pseudomesenteroides TaxID=33968 RepID=UPI0002196144
MKCAHFETIYKKILKKFLVIVPLALKVPVIPESAINLVKQISLSIDQIEHISLENN